MLSSGERIVVEGKSLRTCGAKEGVPRFNHRDTMTTGVVMPVSAPLADRGVGGSSGAASIVVAVVAVAVVVVVVVVAVVV